ncbi:T9SS type A sorting domain-containing protein [Mariniflexile sp. AS56]|uniref:T9SS type A sorting domain-containing protein n=1 Tax=Mariniflexile sp. AS56 TaxID=3063957 RepID=UPI0026F02CB0|nr:T9SS type A sorting domain-containing protein [Mariniflexile sp. AS56]MDO7172430.1 T9SS type A sorting domain-containing protein [Mariniflexile sp. AS56]
MKKQLLFTATLLFASFLTFGQATALDPLETNSQQVRIAETTQTKNFTSGTFGTAGNGAHVNWSHATDVNGTISFDVVSSGADFLASIVFHVRKRHGNSGSVDFTFDGTTDPSFALNEDNTPATVDDFETFNNLAYSQNVTITSVPKTITLDVDITKGSASDVVFRYYSVTFTQQTLGVNDVELNNASISAYPNPATNSFQLNSKENIERVSLYNITGRLLKTFKAEADYDISDLATGMYIANIKTQSGSKTLRIVKK